MIYDTDSGERVLDLSGAVWRRSSYSGAQGNCIEVADGFPDVVPVRDSKAPHGPVLIFSNAGWSSFVSALKGGEFGPPPH